MENQINNEELIKLAAKGDAEAKQKLAAYEWKVGDHAYVKLFGEWEELEISRVKLDKTSGERLTEEEIDHLLWLCTEFDGEDADFLEEAVLYCVSDTDGEIIDDIETDELSDQFYFKTIAFAHFDGGIQFFIEGKCFSDSNKLGRNEDSTMNIDFCGKEFCGFSSDDDDEGDDDEEFEDEEGL